jgi:hypothetical protein
MRLAARQGINPRMELRARTKCLSCKKAGGINSALQTLSQVQKPVNPTGFLREKMLNRPK